MGLTNSFKGTVDYPGLGTRMEQGTWNMEQGVSIVRSPAAPEFEQLALLL